MWLITLTSKCLTFSIVAKIEIKGSGGRTWVKDLNKMNIKQSVEHVDIN